MAEKKEIDALLNKIRELDPRAVMVVYSTREGNVTAMEIAGYEMKDVPMLSHYTRFRFDKMMAAYFTGKGQPVSPTPPMMHAPQSVGTEAIKVPVRTKGPSAVDSGVRMAIKSSKQPAKKKKR